MEKNIDCYTFTCDNCGGDAFEDSEMLCWTDKTIAWDLATEQGWIAHEDKHYCENCWQYDEYDNVKIKSFN